MLEIQRLIKESKMFGSSACLEGRHLWASEGGRACPKEFDDQCSQAVYRCTACGEYD